MKIYKIRNKQTGLFSKGGYYPSWEKLGVVYYSLAKARATIKQAIKHKWWADNYDNNIAEIVEFDLVETKIISMTEEQING